MAATSTGRFLALIAALFWMAQPVIAVPVKDFSDDERTSAPLLTQFVQRNNGPDSGGYRPPAYAPTPPVRPSSPPVYKPQLPPPQSYRPPAYTQPSRPQLPYASPSRPLPQVQRPFAQPAPKIGRAHV